MKIIQNESSIWSNIWDDVNNSEPEFIKRQIEETKKSKDWLFYTNIISENFGGWEYVNSIEVGSGPGWYSLLAASEGAKVTLLDYSQSALELAKERFDLFGLKGEFLFGDAFDIIDLKKDSYNLSWSFGTIEHFSGNLRQEFFQLHFDFLQKKGITIISSPYKYALNYRLWMFYAQKYNEWDFGLEIPYSKSEFLKRLKFSQNNLIKIFFIEGRPCLYKLLNVLRKKSTWRYNFFNFFVRIIYKFKIKIKPLYYRNIVLVASKSSD